MTAPRRRWFRFSLRMLLLLVTVSAIPLGWAAYRLNWIAERRKVLRQHWSSLAEYSHAIAPKPAAPLTLRPFGVAGVRRIFLSNETSPQEVDRIRKLFPESQIVLPGD